MSVLEILQLRVKDGVSPSDPSILKCMETVRASLRQKIQDTKSRCYQCIEDPTLIYIFGIWPSLAAHRAFLASPEKPDILKPQEGILKFNWMLHIPISSMDDIPFDAPVMAIARLHIMSGEHLTEFNRITKKHLHVVEERSKSWKAVAQSRCDSDPGKQELIMLTGWESPEAHHAFIETARKDPEYASVRDHMESRDATHATNMER